MEISFVIPTYNVEDNIEKLLNSINDQDYDGTFKILILDSSRDKTPEIAKKFSNVNIVRVEPEDYNYAETRNLGISKVSGDIIVLLSADILIETKKWLQSLIEPFSDPLVAGVYGRQIPKNDAYLREVFFILHTYPNQKKEYMKNRGGKIEEVFFSNVNSAIRRKVWEEIPFPKMLVTEDREWGKRVLMNDYKLVYSPDAVVVHSHNYTLKEAFKRFYGYGAGHSYIFQDKDVIKPKLLKFGLTYEINQIKFHIQNKELLSIPYVIVYDFTKYIGHLIGGLYKYQPTWIRKKFSINGKYWGSNKEVVDENKI